MSTSLTWSVGRVSLLLYCSVPSSTLPRHPSRRELSCKCTTLSGFSPLHSGAETRRKCTEFVAQVSGSQHLEVEPLGKFNVERTGVQSVLSLVVALAMTIGVQGAPFSQDTFEDVPQTLSAFEVKQKPRTIGSKHHFQQMFQLKGADKGQRIQRPKSAKAESCTRKCVSTCIRGGAGAPGEGPLNVERPLVVFKEGFRTRQYWGWGGVAALSNVVKSAM